MPPRRGSLVSLTLALLTSCYVAVPGPSTVRAASDRRVGVNDIDDDNELPGFADDNDETACELSGDEDETSSFDLSDVDSR
jgi:hypothetical protein